MDRIVITAGEVVLEADLNDSPTAREICAALPLEGQVNVWGDEIYFEIPVAAHEAPDARAEVEVGEVAYWPTGRALCVFFGPTPVSVDDQPRAYSPVNVVGQVVGDATHLRGVRTGARVQVVHKSPDGD